MPNAVSNDLIRAASCASPGRASKWRWFKRAIAHGMWVKARCLAALDGHLPRDGYTAAVQFKLPMTIPAKAAFASWPEGDGRAFAVTDARSGKPHVSGTVTG